MSGTDGFRYEPDRGGETMVAVEEVLTGLDDAEIVSWTGTGSGTGYQSFVDAWATFADNSTTVLDQDRRIGGLVWAMMAGLQDRLAGS